MRCVRVSIGVFLSAEGKAKRLTQPFFINYRVLWGGGLPFEEGEGIGMCS